MSDTRPVAEPITKPLPPQNGYPPADTYAVLMGRAALAASQETGALLAGRDYDLAALQARIALAGAPSAAPELIEEDPQPDTCVFFRDQALEQVRQALSQQTVVVIHLPDDVPVMSFGRAVCVGATPADGAGAGRPAIVRYTPPHASNLPTGADQSLEQALSGRTNLVVLIPSADRLLLGADLDGLSRSLSVRGISVLALSASSAHDWRLTAAEQPHWLNLRSERIYNPRYLADLLRDGLTQRYEHLPQAMRDALQPRVPLVPGLTLAQAAAALGSPMRVRALLSRLDKPGSMAIDPAKLLVWAGRRPLGDLARQWWADLGRRDQLLALALVLLGDLPEGQLFAGLEELVEQVWGLRAPGQPMLDVCDLAPLADMLQLVEHGAAEARLESAVVALRQLVIPLAAGSLRRHVQHAQIWLARLMIRSLDIKPTLSQLLFGLPEQRPYIRATAAEALADFALATPLLARPALLLLIAQGNDTLHHALARALSRWHGTGHMERLQALFTELVTDGRARAIVEALSASDGSTPQGDGAELLSGAALLAYAYAAVPLPSGALDEALIQQMARLAQQSGGHLPRRYLEHEVLPALLPNHLRQLQPLLRELIIDPDWRDLLLSQLLTIYQRGGWRADTVRDTVRGWLINGITVTDGSGRVPPQSPGELRLVSVAEFVSMIDYHEHRGPIEISEAWQYLQMILKSIEGSTARPAVLASSMRLAAQDSSQIVWALGAIHPREEDEMIEALAAINNRQRRALLQSVGDAAYAGIGTELQTELEELMVDWLLGIAHSPRRRSEPLDLWLRLQRIAFAVYAAAAQTRAQELSTPRPQRRMPVIGNLTAFQQRLLNELIDATQPEDLPETADGLLEPVLQLAATEPPTFEALLEQWRAIPELAPLAEWLDTIVKLATNRWEGVRTLGFWRYCGAVVAAMTASRIR